MGAGKTVFVKGLADAFGVREPVTSATFTIIAEYHGEVPLVHADLYRLHGSRDAVEIGLEEYFGVTSAVVVVEWADRAAELFPSTTLWIDISIGENATRVINVQHHEQPRGDQT